MAKTTLSVPVEVRDMLAAVAKSRNTTMLALLEETAVRLKREEMLRQVTLAYEHLSTTDPEEFADYLVEGAEWDATVGDGLAEPADRS